MFTESEKNILIDALEAYMENASVSSKATDIQKTIVSVIKKLTFQTAVTFFHRKIIQLCILRYMKKYALFPQSVSA